LAEELYEKVREAEEEWKKIDRDLLKMMGTDWGFKALLAGNLIVNGNADFLAAAVGIAAGVSLILSTSQRRSFPKKFPAAFFMKLGQGGKS